MVILKLLDEDDKIHNMGGKLCEKPLMDYIIRYIVPTEKSEDNRISLRHVPGCFDVGLHRMVKRAKKAGRDHATQQLITMCAVNWGMSKFQSCGEYRELVETRSDKAQHCRTEAEKKLYMDSTSADVLRDDIKDGPKMKMLITTEAHEHISNIASVIRMSEGEVVIYFYCIGMTRGIDESLFDESQRTPQWEIDKMNAVVAKVDKHLRTMHFDIERFEKIQSIQGTTLI